MEDSPLYLAHKNDRKAENHAHYKRFDEAALCHQKSAELLLQAMQLTSVSKALESLQLQHDYHIRQKDIIRVKKIQHEIKKKILDSRNRRMTSQNKEIKNKDQDLQWAILRTIEDTDSLLNLLVLKDKSDDKVSDKSAGHKKSKDNQSVFEELQTLNVQLRTLVTQLLAKLEASEKQVQALRARLRAYEEDFPCPLPDLTPLEMPQYEYSSGPDDMFPELDKTTN